MGTNYIAPIWRMPENTNKDKLSNYSIDFNGTDEYIDCGNSSNIDITGALSISFWIKASNQTQYRGIISKAVAGTSTIVSSSQYNIEVFGTTSKSIRFVVTGVDLKAGTETTGTVPSLDIDQWQHIVMTWNGTNEMIVYNNGTQAATKTQTSTIASITDNLFIGQRNRTSGQFEGKIAQVCIFNYALTDGTDGTTDQIGYLYDLNNPMAITGRKPVAYWPLGDNSNPNAPGSFPNISVGADSVFDFIPNDYINIPDSDLLSFGDSFDDSPFSVSTWVYFDTTSSSRGIIGKYGTTDSRREWLLYTAAATLRFYLKDGSAYRIRVGTTTLQANNWYHFAATYNGVGGNNAQEGVQIYINGQPETMTSLTSGTYEAMNNTDEPVNIGRYSGTANLDGRETNAQIWSTELTGPEVLTLYNNGQPLMTGTQPQEANLVAWWKLNQSANWEADTAGNWQIPDNKSAYPQSFTFNPGSSSDSVNSPGYYNFTGDFTVSVWAKVHNIAATYGMIFAIGNNSSPPTGPGAYFGFAASNRRFLYDDTSSGAYFTSNNVWEYNEWCHIVVVKEETTYPDHSVQIYINGQPDSITATSNVGVQGQLTLGRWLGGTSYRLDGNISNFQFWDKALSAPQVLTLYNDGTPLTSAIETANLQGWWKLDNTAIWDGSEWDFPDLSGNAQTLRSNAMTIQSLANDNVSVLNGESVGMDTANLVQSNLTRTQPYSNYSLNFDGNSVDYIEVANPGNIIGYGESAFTFSGWINPDSISSNDGIFARYQDPSNRVSIKLGLTSPYDGITLQIQNGSTNGYSEWQNIITTGQWYHICAVYDGPQGAQADRLKLYLNGIDQGIRSTGFGTIPATTTNMTASTPLDIGNDKRSSGRVFDGKVSNYCVFDRVLSDAEILEIYNNGITQDLQATSSFSNNILAWWPMDANNSYYDGTNWTVRDLQGGKDGNGINTGNVVGDMTGTAPGSEASGLGVNLAIEDLKGNMYDSDKNAYSINMADYADGVTNPADSGRSTEVPSV